MSRNIAIALAVYALIGVVTFGHSAAATPPCKAGDMWCVPGEEAVYRGFASGLMWPLYWSWEARHD